MMSEESGYNVTMTSRDDEYNVTYMYLDGNDAEGMYEFYEVPQLVFVSILCVFIIVGNSCVLAAIRLSENGRKSRMNFFIMHLALADLLVGVMVSLTDLASKITIEWYAGNVLCKIIQYSQAVVTYSSTYMLVSLSIDRYDAVARPMNFSRSGYQGRFLVSMAWLVSFVFALPALFIYKETVIEDKKQCWLDFPAIWHWQLFFTAVSVVTFLMPAIIIASCYIAIIYIIWSKGQSHEPHCTAERMAMQQGGTTTPTRLTISDSRHATGRGIIPQAKIRTIKMTLIIVIVFIMCWSPYFLYNLLDTYELLPYNNPMTTFIQSAAPLNSAANPIIYGIFSTRICRNLRRIPMPSCLREMICRCKETRKCNRLAFRGRNHKFMASQTTDPTLTTFDAHRRSNQCLNDLRLSPLKPNDRRYASLITKHFLDRSIFAETAGDLLKRQELEKKQKLFKLSRNKWISDKIGSDYQMAPLTKRGLTRNLCSSGSEDSSATSDSTVRVPNSKRILEIKMLSEINEQNTDVFAKKTKKSGKIANTFPSNPEVSLCRREGKEGKVSSMLNQTCKDHCDKNTKNINISENQQLSSARISGAGHKCKVSHGDNEIENVKVDIKSKNSQDLTGEATLNLEQCAKPVSEKEKYITDNLEKDNQNRTVAGSARTRRTGVQEGTPDRSLASRRPSGVPSVRLRLTSDENAILSSVAEKWLVNEVTTDESSVV